MKLNDPTLNAAGKKLNKILGQIQVLVEEAQKISDESGLPFTLHIHNVWNSYAPEKFIEGTVSKWSERRDDLENNEDRTDEEDAELDALNDMGEIELPNGERFSARGYEYGVPESEGWQASMC